MNLSLYTVILNVLKKENDIIIKTISCDVLAKDDPDAEKEAIELAKSEEYIVRGVAGIKKL